MNPALTLNNVARKLVTSCNLSDLAAQCHVTDKALRAYLIRAGHPVDFTELRESLAGEYDTRESELLTQVSSDTLLEEAAERAARNPVRHPTAYRVDVPERPYLLTFWGDWHVGEAGTDHLRLRDDARVLAELRASIGGSSVLIGMGDYIGGYMRSKTPANNAQVLSPNDQRVAACELLKATRPELVIQGDHDEWHTRHDNEHEWLQDLCRDHALRYAQWGSQLEVVSGEHRLSVLARHRFPGSRGANPYLPQVNLHSTWGAADVVALAHVHSNPGVSKQRARRINEDSFYAVQSGTYKQFDDYGKKLGVGNGEYGVPSVLVLPDEGEIIALPDLADAVRTARAVCR